MDIYDKAADLAKSIKESAEYKSLLETKANIIGRFHTMEVLKEYRQRQFEVQLAQIAGEDFSEDETEVEALYDLMANDPNINDYLTAEYNFTRLMQDIQTILVEGLEIVTEQELRPDHILYN